MKTIRIATWNIGGGILGKSHQKNAKPNLDYYVSIIQQYSPDILCFQEAHQYNGKQQSQIEYIAQVLQYPYSESFPISPSHLESDASLSLGVISRHPIVKSGYTQFHNPNLTSIGPNGDEWVLFDKGYVTYLIDIKGNRLNVVNAHCFPLQFFNALPTEDRFSQIWSDFNDDLLSIRKNNPVVVAIDLNYEKIADLLGTSLGTDTCISAIENTPTTTKGVQQDHILYDSRLRLLNTTVKPTSSDHSYCQATIQL